MSYILDALRRADAERERGSVPGLHAQPMAGAALPSLRGGAGARWWIALAVLAVLLAVLSTALLLRRPEPAPMPAQTSATEATTRSADSPALAAAPTATAPALPAALPADLPPPAARPARPAARPSNAASTASAAAPLRLDQQMANAAPRPAAVPAPAATETRIPDLKELPEELRRQLPALTIGGASYSANAASRMLIINGQVFHEKDPIGPDHVLEQISLKSAVLRFRGTRYSIAY